MNYINVFKTEELFNASKDTLPRPLVSYISENDTVYCLSEIAGPSVEMVDLELPSGRLWAAANIGATCGDTVASWYGNYYAWGETETKQDYTWNTYKFGPSEAITKYNTTDGKVLLESEDDTAAVILKLQMPTDTDVQELLDTNNTSHTWVNRYNDIDGLMGRLFTSKRNSKTLFIPAAGCIDEDGLSSAGNIIRFWLANLDTNIVNTHAKNFFSMGFMCNVSNCARYYGSSIRGVK